MKRLTMQALSLVVVLAGLCAWAQSPEQSFAFAEQLFRDGDDDLALLEFKRFAYTYPQNAKAPDALYYSGIIYLTQKGSIQKAQAAFDRVSRDYPQSAAATQSQEVRKFLETGYDYDGLPIIMYLRAQNAETRQFYDVASADYLGLAQKWPDAKLAVPAILAGTRLQIENLGQAQQAQQTLRQLLTRNLAPTYAAEARYYEARAVDVLGNGGTPAIDAYRKAAAAAPNTDWATKATERAVEIEKKQTLFQRQYNAQQIRQFKVLSEGYADDKVYTMRAEFPTDATQAQVEATLEDALAKLAEKRPNRTDAARVEAFFNYPITKAGIATWKPNEKPAYQIEKRKTEDVLKDSLFNILKTK